MSPSADTGLIVPVHLPAALERLRRSGVPDAVLGLPAHVTVLYPFAPPDALDALLRAQLAGIVGAHGTIELSLSGPHAWPNVLYAAVEPEAEIRALFEHLSASFPEFPLHSGAFPFVPHVTIGEGPAAADLRVDPAWRVLPARTTARSVALIVRREERRRLRWRFPLRERRPPATASRTEPNGWSIRPG